MTLLIASLLLASPAVAFENGRWYDGRGFRAGTRYVVDGRLTLRRPERVDRTEDLKGGFVVPPLGDAHCHHFDGTTFMVAPLRKDGVFYVQSMVNRIRGRDAILKDLNRPDSVDVAFANAGLTCPEGHPAFLYEMLNAPDASEDYAENQRRFKGKRTAEGDAYFNIDTPADLERIWPAYLASKPDLTKLFLLDSGHYAPRRAAAVPGESGLDPALVPLVVRKAHAAGLRAFAHVETGYDFHVGVEAGLDGFAHLPGYGIGDSPADEYRIAPDDARRFGRRRGYVQPTLGIAEAYAKTPEGVVRGRALIRSNLALLKRCGVRFLVGSDHYGQGPWPEIDAWRATGLWTDAELLRIWCRDTPKWIFPKRRIGALDEGSEASFLVVDGDPSRDLTRLRRLFAGYKDGVRVAEIAPAP